MQIWPRDFGTQWLTMIETDLVGVELPEGPQPLLRVCTALLQAELNIIQAYPLIVRPNATRQ